MPDEATLHASIAHACDREDFARRACNTAAKAIRIARSQLMARRAMLHLLANDARAKVDQRLRAARYPLLGNWVRPEPKREMPD